MPCFDHPNFSDGSLVTQAALREDARNNRVPRYRSAPVSGIRAGRITDRERLEQNIAAQTYAFRQWLDALIHRNEMVANLARQRLDGCSTASIESANGLPEHYAQLYGNRVGVTLNADPSLDMDTFDGMRAAMHAQFDALTAPSLDDPNAEHRQGPSDCLSNLRSA